MLKPGYTVKLEATDSCLEACCPSVSVQKRERNLMSLLEKPVPNIHPGIYSHYVLNMTLLINKIYPPDSKLCETKVVFIYDQYCNRISQQLRHLLS